MLKLIKNILPELENGVHSQDVIAMCFFDENVYALFLNNQIGQRLARLAKDKNILLLKGESTDMTNGNPADCMITLIVDGEKVGCFPNIYTAIGDRKPERCIFL